MKVPPPPPKLRILAFATSLLILSGCDGPTKLPDPGSDLDSAGLYGVQPSVQAFATGESPCWVLATDEARPNGANECSANYDASPVRYHTASSSIAQSYYSQWGGTANVAPIQFEFSSPVWELEMRGQDIIFCLGSPSAVTYQGPYGIPDIESAVMEITYPADCGPDEMTWAQQHTPAFVGAIDRVIVAAPTAHEHLLPEGVIAYMRQRYFFEGYDGPPADALNCLTGDRWIDQQAMRDLLADLWARSFAESSLKPKEKAGAVYQDYATAEIRWAYVPSIETQCRSQPPTPSDVPGRILAIAHTHPRSHGDDIPGGCDVNSKWSTYNAHNGTGFSNPDLTNMVSQVDWKVPRFVVLDADNVYASPSRPITELNTHTDTEIFPRQDQAKGCTIV